MRFSAFVPILRIFDEAKAKDFYLGFSWLRARSGASLREERSKLPPTTSMAITQRSRGRGYKYMRPGIDVRPWGTREIKVIDPFFTHHMFFSPQKQG
jgi:hypothetical protein